MDRIRCCSKEFDDRLGDAAVSVGAALASLTTGAPTSLTTLAGVGELTGASDWGGVWGGESQHPHTPKTPEGSADKKK